MGIWEGNSQLFLPRQLLAHSQQPKIFILELRGSVCLKINHSPKSKFSIALF